MAKRAQAQTLTGMEDSAIKPIENAALAYDEKRQVWQALGVELTAAKVKLIDTLKKYEKTTYRRRLGDGSILDIKLQEGKEKVTVTHKDEEPED